MAAQHKVACVFALVLLSCLIAEGATLFSQLSHTLEVSVTGAQNLSANGTKAGSDELYITWSLNATSGADDSAYKTVELVLCFGAPSQLDRGWRKSHDSLSKDKSCSFDLASQPYTPAGNSAVWAVTKDIPTAYYFVRAYALDSAGEKVAYGQTSSALRTTNLFAIEAVSGRHTSIDIAAGVFSAFSILSLFGFFFYEKYAAKRSK